jgi:tetratricopeptide (TPR) repeat protein
MPKRPTTPAQALRASLLAAALALGASGALAQTLTGSAADAYVAEEQERIAACLELTQSDAEAAYEYGLRWEGQYGGRPLARYCTAMGLIALEAFEEGALRLEQLANAPDAGDMSRRAIYLAQAGNGWLLAERPDEALVALGNALKIAPRDPGILADRAAAHLMRGEAQTAIGDLNAALEVAPQDAEALFLRARAFLATDRLQLALQDIEQARTQDPTNVDMVVLRGEIREAIRLAAEAG